MVGILTKWKQKQGEDKPLLIVMTTSGGGNKERNFYYECVAKVR